MILSAPFYLHLFYLDQKTLIVSKYVTNVSRSDFEILKISRKLAFVNQKRRFSPNIKLVFKRLINFWSSQSVDRVLLR
jgi:hypothetical protein